MGAMAAAVDDPVRRNIIDAALRLAHAAGSWDSVHVHAVAREAGVSVPELARHFEGKDDIAEGFFDRADAALLAVGDAPGWSELPERERLYRAIIGWFDALAPYRLLAREMLGYRLHPEHVHLQVRGVARISRTVQWIREVALLRSAGWRRELEEAVLTTIYLTTFWRWLTDASPGSQRTRRLLDSLLTRAERASRWLPQPA